MITVQRKISIQKAERGRQRVRKETAPKPVIEPGRIPRISRLMALAIRFERLLREGVVADQSALARVAHVTQPRMTQIMNLLHLAPEIQEALLFLPPVVAGKDPVTERELRAVAAELGWVRQQALAAELTIGQVT